MKNNKNNKHIKSFNEASENLNISDVSRSFSIDDLQKAFEEGYKLYNNEGNKYMGFEVKKQKENMMKRAFNRFLDENYD